MEELLKLDPSIRVYATLEEYFEWISNCFSQYPLHGVIEEKKQPKLVFFRSDSLPDNFKELILSAVRISIDCTPFSEGLNEPAMIPRTNPNHLRIQVPVFELPRYASGQIGSLVNSNLWLSLVNQFIAITQEGVWYQFRKQKPYKTDIRFTNNAKYFIEANPEPIEGHRGKIVGFGNTLPKK